MILNGFIENTKRNTHGGNSAYMKLLLSMVFNKQMVFIEYYNDTKQKNYLVQYKNKQNLMLKGKKSGNK